VRAQLFDLRGDQQQARANADTTRMGFEAQPRDYVQLQLARIYMIVAEPEQVMDQLELLLKMPYYLSSGWLRIDPTWAPAQGQPALQEARCGRVTSSLP